MIFTDKLLHKWLKVPYTLNVDDIKPKTKPKQTVILVHGIGNNKKTWQELTSRMPKDVRIVAIDLLGFGQSPKPDWAVYDAKTQARSIVTTLVKLRVFGKVVIVGHSLGSLVAIEVAKQFSPVVSKLILCSPPLYKPEDKRNTDLFSGDKLLTQMYEKAIEHPKTFIKVTDLLTKYKITDKSFKVNESNIGTYMATLQSSIINQTALSDAQKLKIPILILQGKFDPLVISKNVKELADKNNIIKIKSLTATHELSEKYFNLIIEELD